MPAEKKYFFWIDGLKAFAIIGIILNHFVESFGSYPWFSNPSYDWPELSIRLSEVLPVNGSVLWRVIQFIGWLGDMGPGVFILVSGFTLTLSSLNKNGKEISITDFWLKRLVRIFPLYISIHFLIMLCGAAFNSAPDFSSPKVFLSMLGLRFTDGLFFYINPSWWFIWLIIQLYLVFPLLFKLLAQRGIKIFLFITLGFTVAARLAGLLDFTWSDKLEYWMTGIFFGTRLSEFAAGMILAKLFAEKRFGTFSIRKLFTVSVAIYTVGFASSLFYFTTLISNSLITLGLTGIFLVVYRAIEIYIPSIVKPVRWIGMISFPLFLLHQPLMTWAGRGLGGMNKGIVEASVLLLCFPFAWVIEKAINQTIALLQKIKDKFIISLFIASISGQVLLNAVHFLTGNDLFYKADIVIFIINIFFIPLFLLLGYKANSGFLKVFLMLFIPASILFLFILIKSWFSIFWIFSLIMLAVMGIVSVFTEKVPKCSIITFIVTCTLFIAFEFILRAHHPVEVNKWGESAALQKDPETVYSLIPEKETRLKYNNYDYYVRTNSYGFNGPEINPAARDNNEIRLLVIGDAFTMPEGMEYNRAYPMLLQQLLQADYPGENIRVFNAAVTGYGPNEMYPQLVKYIDIIRPHIYINQVFINEYSEITLTANARLDDIGLRHFPLRERLSGGWQIPVRIRSGIHRVLNDDVNDNYNYRKSLTYYYECNSTLYKHETLDTLRDYMGSVKRMCAERGCTFIMLYAPGQMEISSPAEIEYYPVHINFGDTLKYNPDLPRSIFRQLCSEAGVTFLDPTGALRTNNKQPVYFTGSWHWNETGHEVVAEFLEGELHDFINRMQGR